MKTIYLSIYLFLVFGMINAKTIKVPEDQTTIQKAIEKASNGDTILVSSGRYFENINFRDKNLVLTSYYSIAHDTSYILNTIIDGSMPTYPDSASCIIIAGKQNSTTLVQGFTITGGQGTKWKDENSDGTYREGGGILVAVSSPIISNNLIINNFATNKAGLSGTGGGGIRCGDGSAQILNNVIINNEGRYGAGLVFNWCSATIRNNIIAFNHGGEDYGSGGIWINGSGTGGKPNILENNTIVNNHSATDGGGLLLYNANAKAILKNNIIYGNTAASAPQIALRGASASVTYSNIQGGWLGEGNIDILPGFTDSLFYLNTLSPCIDAGNPETNFNDNFDPTNQDSALYPSQASLRNDLGAYGGAEACVLPNFKFSRIGVSKLSISFGNSNLVGAPATKTIYLANQSIDTRMIDSVAIKGDGNNLQITYKPQPVLKPAQSDSIKVEWTPVSETTLDDTILIYHNTMDVSNPLKIVVSGKAKSTTSYIDEKSNMKINLFPNPTSDFVSFNINDKKVNNCFIYNATGQKVKYEALHVGLNKLNVMSLSKGIYFVQIPLTNTVLTEKLVVN